MRQEEVPARPECPEPQRWAAPDGEATETDVSALVAAFVVALKPDYVVETGAYQGHTSAQIGWALVQVGRGRLVSVELDPARAADAMVRVEGLPVTIVGGLASEFVPAHPIDLLFIDCGMADRIKQLRHFKPYASPRCVILYHDSALWEEAEGVPEMHADRQLAVDEGTVLTWVLLPTPRGLAITRYADAFHRV